MKSTRCRDGGARPRHPLHDQPGTEGRHRPPARRAASRRVLLLQLGDDAGPGAAVLQPGVEGRLRDRRRALRRGRPVHAHRRRPDDHGGQRQGLRPASHHERQGPARPARTPGTRCSTSRASPPASSSRTSPTSGPSRASCRRRSKPSRACGPQSCTSPCPRTRSSSPTRPSRPPRCCSTSRPAPSSRASRSRRSPTSSPPAVQGMDPSGVTVADSTGQVLSSPGGGLSAGRRRRPLGRRRSRLREPAQRQRAADPRPGRRRRTTRRCRSAPTVDLSQKQSTAETYTYTPGTPPLSSSTSTEKYNGNGTPVGGVLGPENIPIVPTGGGGVELRPRTTTTDNNAVGKTVTDDGRRRPGDLKRLTVSVVHGQRRRGQAEPEPDPVAWSATPSASTPPAATPSPSRRCRSTTTAAKQAAADLAAARAADASAQMWSMIKHRRHRRRASCWSSCWSGCARAAAPRRSRRSTSRSSSPTTCSPSSTGCGSPAPAKRSGQLGPRSTTGQLELEAAERQKVRGDISTMVSEKPDEVAAMLRGWLSETKS